MKLSTFNYDKKDIIATSLSLGMPLNCPGNKEKSTVYAQCGMGLGCSGGNGECGMGLNCGGSGNLGGYGQCGIGLGCSGGGGQCGMGLNCGGW